MTGHDIERCGLAWVGLHRWVGWLPPRLDHLSSVCVIVIPRTSRVPVPDVMHRARRSTERKRKKVRVTQQKLNVPPCVPYPSPIVVVVGSAPIQSHGSVPTGYCWPGFYFPSFLLQVLLLGNLEGSQVCPN